MVGKSNLALPYRLLQQFLSVYMLMVKTPLAAVWKGTGRGASQTVKSLLLGVKCFPALEPVEGVRLSATIWKYYVRGVKLLSSFGAFWGWGPNRFPDRVLCIWDSRKKELGFKTREFRGICEQKAAELVAVDELVKEDQRQNFDENCIQWCEWEKKKIKYQTFLIWNLYLL